MVGNFPYYHNFPSIKTPKKCCYLKFEQNGNQANGAGKISDSIEPDQTASIRKPDDVPLLS